MPPLNQILNKTQIEGVTDSVTEMLLNLRSPSCSTILHNSSVTFNRYWSNCYELVVHFGAILKLPEFGLISARVYSASKRSVNIGMCCAWASVNSNSFVTESW